MTGLETILIGAGSFSVAAFGTFIATARYYQGKVEKLRDDVEQRLALMVTQKECDRCKEQSEKDADKSGEAMEEVLRQIGSLASKYDRILKILILNVDIPNEVRKEILP